MSKRLKANNESHPEKDGFRLFKGFVYLADMYARNKVRRTKKIRGWKRRVKALQYWAEQITEPYLESFDLRGYTYEKAIIKDFYIGGGKRQPPLWFFKLIVARFVEAFENWDKTFKYYGQPYDLQLWIYESNYILSTLECRKVESQGDEYNCFTRFTKQYDFPLGRFANGNIEALSKLKWTRCAEETYIEQYDIDCGEYTLQGLLDNGYEKETYKNGDVSYAKTIGTVWVGRLK